MQYEIRFLECIFCRSVQKHVLKAACDQNLSYAIVLGYFLDVINESIFAERKVKMVKPNTS